MSYYYKNYDGWEGYSIICPKASDKIVFKGTEQSMKASAMMF